MYNADMFGLAVSAHSSLLEVQLSPAAERLINANVSRLLFLVPCFNINLREKNQIRKEKFANLQEEICKFNTRHF